MDGSVRQPPWLRCKEGVRVAGRLLRSDLGLALLLVILGVLVFVGTDIQVSQDMGLYMSRATNLVHGRGYTDMDGAPVYTRPPGFVGLVALAFALFGRLVGSGFLVVRFFAVLNPVLVFFLGRRLFNRRVGFMAAVLFLVSIPILHASDRHLDHVWPAFILLQFLFLHLGWTTRRHRWLVLSGIFLGVAALIKETALLCALVPMAIILVQERPRWRHILLGWCATWGGLLAVFAPWAAWVIAHVGPLELLGIGTARAMESSSVSSGGGWATLLGLVRSYFVGIGNYFVHGAHANSYLQRFLIAPLHFGAWVATAWNAARRRPSSVLLVAALVCYSPVLATTGIRDMRLGQGLLFFMLTAIVTAHWIDAAVMWICERYRKRGRALRMTQTLVLCAGIVVAVVGAQAILGYLVRDDSYEIVLRMGTFKALTGHASGVRVTDVLYGEGANREAGAWIASKLPDGTKLAIARAVEGQPVFFFSDGDSPMLLFPEIESGLDTAMRTTSSSTVYLSAFARGLDPKNRFLALREDELLRFIEGQRVEYVLVGMQKNYLALYFHGHTGFDEVASFGDGQVVAFRVETTSPFPEFQTLVDTRATDYLSALADGDASRYRESLEKFFDPVLGWTEGDIESVRAGLSGRVVESWQVYDPR